MNRGEFDDPHAAIDRAMELVDEALGRCFPSVKNAEDLMRLYTIYGDEVPMIHGEPRIGFNAYDYARVKAVSMFASEPNETAIQEAHLEMSEVDAGKAFEITGTRPRNRRVPELSDGGRVGLAFDQRPRLEGRCWRC